MFDRIRPDVAELFVFFLISLPAGSVAAKLYGLYDRDEERTDHSTTDDVVGVFHLVTVGAWVLFAGAWLTRVTYPDLTKTHLFWALAILFITVGRVDRPQRSCGGARPTCRTRSSSAAAT